MINFVDLCWGETFHETLRERQYERDTSRDTSEEPQELQEIESYKTKAAIEPQIDNVESFLLVFYLFLLTVMYQGIIDKTTFISLNRFFALSKTPKPLFLTENIKLAGIPIKIK